jgi:hypothetical protein
MWDLRKLARKLKALGRRIPKFTDKNYTLSHLMEEQTVIHGNYVWFIDLQIIIKPFICLFALGKMFRWEWFDRFQSIGRVLSGSSGTFQYTFTDS